MAPCRLPRLFAFLLALGLTPTNVVSKSEWDYDRGGAHGPQNWPGLCQTGSRQSPVDIVAKHASPVNFGDLHFRNYDDPLHYNDSTVHNNGHTVALEYGAENTAALRDGGLESVYLLDHVHFHSPSEHTFNGRRHPLEAHLVHRDHRSATVSEAAKTRDGIAVLGVLFHVSDVPNQKLQDLTEALKRLNGVIGGRVGFSAGGSMSIDSLLPQKKERFFRYYGSLTTPQCQESVVWTVFEESIPISEEQLKQFRMPDSNFRPAQNLNRRFVLHNGACLDEKIHRTSGASPSSPWPVLLLLLHSALLLLPY